MLRPDVRNQFYATEMEAAQDIYWHAVFDARAMCHEVEGKVDLAMRHRGGLGRTGARDDVVIGEAFGAQKFLCDILGARQSLESSPSGFCRFRRWLGELGGDPAAPRDQRQRLPFSAGQEFGGGFA